MNFVLFKPGPATALFPKTLSISHSKVKSYPVNGNLFLLTIYVSNPESYVFGAEVLHCWMKSDCAVVPRSVVYRDGVSDEQEIAQGTKEMSQSQNLALKAAKSYIAKKYPEINLSALNDSSIKVALENTGGPSGGLIFTLGLIDLLTPADIIDGQRIAGTGTISPSGAIGAIGGVVEKIVGAKKAGANLLFISRENCAELPSQVEGISVVAISTIDEAVSYLLEPSHRGKNVKEGLNSAGIHGCASVGA